MRRSLEITVFPEANFAVIWIGLYIEVCRLFGKNLTHEFAIINVRMPDIVSLSNTPLKIV